jgi:hypothetical protein
LDFRCMGLATVISDPVHSVAPPPQPGRGGGGGVFFFYFFFDGPPPPRPNTTPQPRPPPPPAPEAPLHTLRLCRCKICRAWCTKFSDPALNLYAASHRAVFLWLKVKCSDMRRAENCIASLQPSRPSAPRPVRLARFLSPVVRRSEWGFLSPHPPPSRWPSPRSLFAAAVRDWPLARVPMARLLLTTVE